MAGGEVEAVLEQVVGSDLATSTNVTSVRYNAEGLTSSTKTNQKRLYYRQTDNMTKWPNQ